MTAECSICGRRLKNLQSMKLGYGPVCYRRKFGITSNSIRRNVDVSAGKTFGSDLPGQMSIDDYLQGFQ
ncbi:DUF6011 domain-containing protein [Petralouisia muris]|uniref:DUF6011 domain-containing protein n=1 Tax=Petralouisia muris TaxID=3032872 RepID=UPI00267DFD31